MNFVVGIDQSVLHTGVCILDETGATTYLGLIEPSKLKNYDRLAYIRDALSDILGDTRYIVGALEGYSYGSVNKKYLLGEIGAIVKLALHDRCDVVHVVAPTQVKLFTAGRGSASKETVMKAVERQWGVSLNDDNLADAYSLARVALEVAFPNTKNRNQLEVVKAVSSAKPTPKRRARIRQFKDAV